MKGIVYALTNPSMPGLVKIGKTTDLDNRMKQLYGHAGVPAPFSCIYAREVDDMDTLEKGIHDFLSNGRANERREFFCTDEKEIIKLFDLLPGSDVTPGKQLEKQESVAELYSIRVDHDCLIESDTILGLIDQAAPHLEGSPLNVTESLINSRKNKGWTLEQAFGFEVPPNFEEVNKLVEVGYSYFPHRPYQDNNTKPIVLHSLKRIYISQKHFADEHGIPTDYVSDKLKLGWDADRIIESYGS